MTNLIKALLRRLFSTGSDPAPSPSPVITPRETRSPWETVYVTTGGTHYHYDDNCSALRGAKVYKMDRAKARAAGRTVCGKCANYWSEFWYD
jgi:hypothetical protein